MNLTTARHQNANGQAENAVKTFKNMMTTVLNRTETSSWIEVLPFIQLAYNNTPHSSTGFSPNEMTYGQNVADSTTIVQATGIDDADTLSERIHKIVREVTNNLSSAQQRQAKCYNRTRSTEVFNVNDEVLLAIDGLDIKTSPKYTNKFMGPFKIMEVLPKDNYRLDLPSTMRIHAVMHISKLARYKSPAQTSYQASIQRPKPVVINKNNQVHHEIDRIVDHRFKRNRFGSRKEYLCKWTGYSNAENTWQSAVILLQDAPAIVEAYEKSL